LRVLFLHLVLDVLAFLGEPVLDDRKRSFPQLFLPRVQLLFAEAKTWVRIAVSRITERHRRAGGRESTRTSEVDAQFSLGTLEGVVVKVGDTWPHLVRRYIELLVQLVHDRAAELLLSALQQMVHILLTQALDKLLDMFAECLQRCWCTCRGEGLEDSASMQHSGVRGREDGRESHLALFVVLPRHTGDERGLGVPLKEGDGVVLQVVEARGQV
jgi:hypothetical protein